MPIESESNAELAAEMTALRQEQAALDQRLQIIEKRLKISAQPTPQIAKKPRFVFQGQSWEQWLGLQGFAWIGILALISGLVLFIRFAYLEGWLGALATLFSGAAVSASMILGGDYLSRRDSMRSWAHALMGGGVALLYFLIYAAYHFSYFREVTHFNALVDTLLLMAVVALAIVLALRRQSQSLASRAFMLGFVTSLFSQQFQLLTVFYNLFLSLGLIFVAAIGRWQHMALLGICGSWVLHAVWWYDNPEALILLQSLNTLYFLLYAGLGEWFHQQELPGTQQSQQALILINAFAYSALSYSAYRLLPAHQALLFTLIFLTAVLGLIGWAYARKQSLLLRHGLPLSIAILSLGLILEWHFQSGLAVGLLILALGLSFLAKWLHQQTPALSINCEFLALLCSLRALFAIFDDSPGLGLALCLLSVALVWYRQSKPQGFALVWLTQSTALAYLLIEGFPETYQIASQFSALAAGLHGLGLICLLISLLYFRSRFDQNQTLLLLLPLSLTGLRWLQLTASVSWVSVSWAICGTLWVSLGFWIKLPLLRMHGLGILLVAGLKVYLFDLSDLALIYRISSLVILGALMLGIALIYTRYKKTQQEPS